jgi:hypothetical protein
MAIMVADSFMPKRFIRNSVLGCEMRGGPRRIFLTRFFIAQKKEKAISPFWLRSVRFRAFRFGEQKSFARVSDDAACAATAIP